MTVNSGDWLLNANHAALFAAGQCGAFSRAGLQVALVSPSDPDFPSRLVAAAGLPVLRVATLIDRPLDTVMALGGGSIRSLADLRATASAFPSAASRRRARRPGTADRGRAIRSAPGAPHEGQQRRRIRLRDG